MHIVLHLFHDAFVNNNSCSFSNIAFAKFYQNYNYYNGYKEVLGIWIGKSESSSFWISVLTDLKSRDVEDILITVTDNLNGFTDAIKTVFPKSTTQICVVQQIRNSCKYVVGRI
jgi:hypothetical protein